MSDRAGFLNAILADPADDVARLSYADWLRDQPGAFDQLHGRFMWAGLTLARFRGMDVVEDGMFFDALRDQTDATPTVLSTQLRHVLGWDRLTTEWAWDNETNAPDRIHVVAIPPKTEGETRNERRERRRNPVLTSAVTYERGCLTALRLTAAQWQAAGPAILQSCPLESVQLLEVPGLTLRILNQDGWRVRGELRPLRPQSRNQVDTFRDLDATMPFLDEPGDTRKALPQRVLYHTAQVLGRLHYFAGWSRVGPLPESLMAPGPRVGVDPSAELLGGT